MKRTIMFLLAVAAIGCLIYLIVNKETIVAITSSIITLVTILIWFVDSKENKRLKKQVNVLDDVAGSLAEEVNKKANADQGYYD